MKKIQRTISLEPMTSRIPSVVPSYKDNVLYYFDDDSLKGRDYKYQSNYGMVPVSIGYEYKDNSYEYSCSGSTISFERLSQWYHFFNEYHNLLSGSSHCGMVYSSATQYYENESVGRYINQLIYGNDEETYIEMDERYNEMGGDKFYEWICKNLIPTYYISMDYKDYWNADRLYYPDVIKWIAWFSERSHYEDDAHFSGKTDNDIEHWNCKSSGVSNCCDCDEYFKRGGKRELSSMTNWYDSIQSGITELNNFVSENLSCVTPYMHSEIELSNSLDDLGQFSIFSIDYDVNTDYRTVKTEVVDNSVSTKIYYENGNIHSGTVADVSGETMLLVDDKSGFCFSDKYMEKIYDKSAWSSYTRSYIADSAHINEFVVSSANTYYAIDDDGNMYFGDSPKAVSGFMSSAITYDIEEYDSILIDGELYPIAKTEYGIYDLSNKFISGRTYFVDREKETNTPYTLINGKKIYADLYTYPSGTSVYYFSFFKNTNGYTTIDNCSDVTPFNIDDYKIFDRNVKDDGLLSYIQYGDRIFSADTSGVTIDYIDYPRISGYSMDELNSIIYISCNTTSCSAYDYNMDVISGLTVKGDKIYKDVYNDTINIYNAKQVTGNTISKLTELINPTCLVDDVGDRINGLYEPNSGSTNHQPSGGTTLELLYQIGNTANVNKFKLTSGDVQTIGDVNYFIGDIITDMIFYYKDIDGNEIIETSADTKIYNNSSLSAISASTDALTSLADTIIVDESGIYCDVTYYVGATLALKNPPKYELAYSADTNYNYGVRYDETVKFVKTPVIYGLKKANTKVSPTEVTDPSNSKVGYVIYTYELEQNSLAKFTTEINLVDSGLTTVYSGYTDMEDYNNIHVSPTYREEYMLGIATMENVDSDIYIERGINATFEKHLKLGEVSSLDDLLNFGNKFFKIMED